MPTERTTTLRKDTAVPKPSDGEIPDGAADDGGPRRRRRGLLAVAVILVVAALAYFVVKPFPEAAPKPVQPKPGPIVQLDAVTMNLSGGHFLKLGLALQPTADAGEDLNGAKALDLAITLFSGRTLAELSSRDGREKAKSALVQSVTKAYEGKVYDLYFTTFVMQ
jgi:flagellar FliL protein